MELDDPEDITHDIYDELANLEKWQDILSDMISENTISQEEFDAEMLKTRYYIDKKTKTYIVDSDDQELLNKLSVYKKSLSENYKFGIISEEEFNKEYTKILRKEYEILKRSESDSKESDSVILDMDEPLSDKLKKLAKAEATFNKSIAKKYNIQLPSLPRGIKGTDVDDYYDKKIGNVPQEINESIEGYISLYSAAQEKIDYYTSSYEVTKIIYNPETKMSDFEFKKLAPMASNIDEIKNIESRSSLLTPDEQLYSERINNLKKRMRQMSRDELLNCIGARTFKYMSYIERLKQNKQHVLKFKEHPENYEELKKYISEDLKYYKIQSDKLFKDYIYSHPSVYLNQVQEEPEDLTSYTQTGKISYLAFKEGANLKDLGSGLDNFVTIKPFPDELYTELMEKEGENTEIATAWELRMSLPGSEVKNITKRYISFKDYLKDLKEILIQNSKKLTGKSKDIVLTKIRKISFYINYDEDIESYSSRGQISIENLFKNRIEIMTMRKKGVYSLMEYIGSFYPGSQLLIERIEADIFDYSSKNYERNIKKLLFILKNYQNKLEDLVEGQESIVNILTYEIPKNIPEDDIDIDNKEESIRTLLSWKPNTSDYDKYEDELIRDNHKFYKFRKEHPELSILYISEIMSQYSEKILWSRSLKKYETLKVPEGYIELNYRLRFLLKNRNKLPSRRIFRLATVAERIYSQTQLKAVFKTCKLTDPENYGNLTENIIFGLAKTPEDYDYYISLVKNRYLSMCQYFTDLTKKCTLDIDGTISCMTEFDANVLIPVITEFLVTQGDFSTVDIVRLTKFMEQIEGDKVLEYIKSLRESEIKSYFNSSMEELNKTNLNLDDIHMKASRILLSKLKLKRMDQLKNIAYNIYKPPIVSLEKPVKYIFGTMYTPNYIKIGEYYIYGGYYPNFYKYSEEGNIEKQNYSRNDLEQLSSIFDVEISEVDDFTLYLNIMNKIRNLSENIVINTFKAYVPTDYSHVDYLQAPSKTIFYTTRPRMGVPEPGEVYSVYKDPERTFGVPFRYNKDTIPVYAEGLKQRIIDGFVLVEGPSIFEQTDKNNEIVSNRYINIEYLDSRGKSKIFREGVSEKKIQQRKEEALESCSRFTNEMTCNNPNSYSLDIRGLKYKCQWLKKYVFGQEVGECKGISVLQTQEIANFKLDEVKFEDPEKNKLWNQGVERAIEYIESIVKLKEITKPEIELLSVEQKARLYVFYQKLLSAQETKPEPDIPTQNYSLVEMFPDIFNREEIVNNPKDISSEYTNITLYKQEMTQRHLPFRVKIGNEYTVNGIVVIPLVFDKSTLSYTCKVKDSDDEVILEQDLFRKKSATLQMTTKPVFCLISNENTSLLNNYMSYSWTLLSEEYIRKEDDVIKREKREVKTFVPLNFIIPTGELNGSLVVTKEDIYAAMYRTAFSVLTTEDNMIYNITEKVNAQEEAIEFAIKNNIDIIKLQDKIVGTITILDVTEEFESRLPKKIINKDELTALIQTAVQNADRNTVIKYFLKAKQAKIDKDLLKQAKEVIKEEPKTKPEPEPVKEVTEAKNPKANVYTSQRRRR